MAAVIVLAGSFRIAPEHRAEALAAAEAMIAATRAEPGCIAYSFAVDLLDDHLIRVFEVFEDADALAAHRASPHMATWRAQAAAIGLSERRMAQYDVADWRAI